MPFVDSLKKSSTPMAGFTTSPDTPFIVPVNSPMAPFFFTSFTGVVTTPFTPLHSDAPIALDPDFRPICDLVISGLLLPKVSSVFWLSRIARFKQNWLS